MATTLADYADAQLYQLGRDETGNSYARGDLTQVAVAPVIYNAQRPTKIELTVSALSANAETVNITSPVAITLYARIPIAVGNNLGVNSAAIDGIIIPTVDTVIPATVATALPILPYVGTPIVSSSIAAIYEGLRPCSFVEEAVFPQISADTSMTQNKAQGPWKTSDVFTRSWTSNLNGALLRSDASLPLLFDKAQGWAKLYIMITQAPFDEFSDGNGGLLKYGAGPSACEGLVTVGNTSVTDARGENQKVSIALTGDGRPVPYSILIPDV